MAKDYSDYAGCCELAETIRKYWHARGKHPAVYVSKRYVSDKNTRGLTVHYDITSNMVGGQPQ